MCDLIVLVSDHCLAQHTSYYLNKLDVTIITIYFNLQILWKSVDMIVKTKKQDTCHWPVKCLD